MQGTLFRACARFGQAVHCIHVPAGALIGSDSSLAERTTVVAPSAQNWCSSLPHSPFASGMSAAAAGKGSGKAARGSVGRAWAAAADRSRSRGGRGTISNYTAPLPPTL